MFHNFQILVRVNKDHKLEKWTDLNRDSVGTFYEIVSSKNKPPIIKEVLPECSSS